MLSEKARNVSTGGVFGVSSPGSPGDVLEYCVSTAPPLCQHCVVYENAGASGVTGTAP